MLTLVMFSLHYIGQLKYIALCIRFYHAVVPPLLGICSILCDNPKSRIFFLGGVQLLPLDPLLSLEKILTVLFQWPKC